MTGWDDELVAGRFPVGVDDQGRVVWNDELVSDDGWGLEAEANTRSRHARILGGLGDPEEVRVPSFGFPDDVVPGAQRARWRVELRYGSGDGVGGWTAEGDGPTDCPSAQTAWSAALAELHR